MLITIATVCAMLTVAPTIGSTFDPQESPYRSEVLEPMELILILGSNLDSAPADIPDRYTCDQNEITFTVDPPDSLSVEVTITTSFDLQDNPSCVIAWNDGSLDETVKFVKTDGPTLTLDHSFPAHGVYTPLFSCSADKESETCPGNVSSCAADTTLFHPFFKDSSTPLQLRLTESFIVTTTFTISEGCQSFQANYNWRLFHINGSSVTPVVDFPQPGISALKLLPQTMEPGLYVAEIEVTFPGRSAADWITDFIYVRVVLPELIAAIAGGTQLTVPQGEPYIAVATKSRDPVTRLESITSLPLETNWSVVCYPTLDENSLNDYVTLFPHGSLPPGSSAVALGSGTGYQCSVPVGADQWCLLLFTIRRGDRASSAIQVLETNTNPVNVTLRCVFNCNEGREMKIAQEQIQFDSVTTLAADSVTYKWMVEKWHPAYKTFQDVSATVVTDTGLTTRSLSVPKGQLVPGSTYRFTVMASTGSQEAGRAGYIRTVAYLPYNGNCTLDRTTGQATTDLFTVSCHNWQGADERRLKDDLDTTNAQDRNPLLSFLVLQNTAGAVVQEEPIAFSKSRRFHVLVKMGDPDQNFASNLLVRVTDIYNQFTETEITIQAEPAFDVTAVNKTETGASVVRAFMTTGYQSSRDRLSSLGKTDLLVVHATSVVSHFHQIELPEWQPPVPRAVDTVGADIVDLVPGGANKQSSLDTLTDETFNETVDPATLTIREAIENMTTSLVKALGDDVVNGTRREDTNYISLFSNAFTNLVAKSNFVSTNVKVSLIAAGSLSSTVALFPPDAQEAGDDVGMQIEASSAELVSLYERTVKTVVPDKLRQLSDVDDFTRGRHTIADQLSARGDNYSLESARMAPGERAFLYLQLQRLLAFNLDKERAQAKAAAKSALKIARDIQMATKLCLTCSNENRTNAKQILVKHSAEVVSQRAIPSRNSAIELTGLSNQTNDSVSVSVVNFEENVFMYDSNRRSSVISSEVVHVDVRSNTDDATVSTGYVTYEQNVATPDPFRTVPTLDPEDASQFSLHQFIYRFTGDYVCLMVEPRDAADDRQTYNIYVNFDEAPTLLAHTVLTEVRRDRDWLVCIPPLQMRGHTGLTYLGVQIDGEHKERPYDFTLITVACMVWEEGRQEWLWNKCELQWLPKQNKIRCQCTDVTDLTFGNTFYVAPNTIDFSSVFLRFSPLNQAAVIGTMAAILVVYILTVVWARRMDRWDVLKWGITPLRDNVYSHSYFYIMTVYTGLRRGAGTTSRVGFVLTGNHTDTGDRELGDGVRQEFERGSVLSFLVATKKHLGDLFHLAVWHDNSGQDDLASWYPSKIVVQDLHTDNTYTFVCETWLSVETALEIRVLPNFRGHGVPFVSRFFHHTKQRLAEGHMWISIAYRPTSSNFRRVERASCALVYLLLTMVAGAVYFNPADNYQVPALVQAGPFRFTLQQMYVSLVSALISTPVVVLIAFLFQRTRRPLSPSLVRNSYMGGKRNEKPSNISRTQRHYLKSQELEACLLRKGLPDYSGFYLHYTFQYIGWALVFIGTVLSAFFILLYSMEWGKQKSEEWLTTSVLSLVESFIFLDPIVVLSMALALSLIVRSGQTASTPVDKVELLLSYRKHFRRNPPYTPDPPARPVGGDDLELAAKRSRHRKMLSSAFKNILINFFFMWLIFSISFSNRDDRSYYLHREITNKLVSPSKLPHFEKIKTPNDVYVWLNYTVFPGLFPVHDINGVELHWTVREFMAGFVNYRLGPPRLRQLRTKKRTCTMPYLGQQQCFDGYGFSEEETSDYCIGWQASPCSAIQGVYNYSADTWQHTSALATWGIPVAGQYTVYNGGGYIAELAVSLNTSRKILDELYQQLWLDRQTRVLLLDFTLYSPNVNLFVYSVFLVEFPETGGAFTSYKTFPLRVYTHGGLNGLYTLVCELLFVLFLIFLLTKICITFYQQRWKYFRHVWQVYELVVLALGLTAVAVFFVRFGVANTTVSRFQQDPKIFVNFYHVVVWDELLTVLLGFLSFMACFRFLQVFEASKMINAALKSFERCRSDLFAFGLTFSFILTGFAMLGFLLFGRILYSYMSIYRTLATLCLLILGSNRFAEMKETDPIWAQIYFLIFTWIVIFFIFTLFVSILSSSVDAITSEMRHDTEEDLVDLILAMFRRLCWTPAATIKSGPSRNHAKVCPDDRSPESSPSTSGTESELSWLPSSEPHIKVALILLLESGCVVDAGHVVQLGALIKRLVRAKKLNKR